jgi:hypothetical protein
MENRFAGAIIMNETRAEYNVVITTSNEEKQQSLTALGCTGIENCTPLEIRYRICALELSMQKALEFGELTECEFPLYHHFHDGIYTRGVFLPAGTVVVGKIHKFAHINKIHQGKVTVVTEEGGVETLTAPYSMISPAAVKRAIYVHEDTIWSVDHETSLTDLDEIEEEVIAKTYTQLGLEDPFEQFKLQQTTTVLAVVREN